MDKVTSISDYKQKKKDKEEQVEKQIVEQEYNEFIKLLRYFVETQQSKHKLILVNKKDNKYILTDENAAVVDSYSEDLTVELAAAREDINYDDLLISTLITIAPKIICINAEDISKELLAYIKLVFDTVIVL